MKKSYLRCVHENIDYTNRTLGTILTFCFGFGLIMSFFACFIIGTGWPLRIMPLDDTDSCPVILNTDDYWLAQDKIHKCQEWYASQY